MPVLSSLAGRIRLTPAAVRAGILISCGVSLTIMALYWATQHFTHSHTLVLYSGMLWGGVLGIWLARQLGFSGWRGFAAGSPLAIMLQVMVWAL